MYYAEYLALCRKGVAALHSFGIGESGSAICDSRDDIRSQQQRLRKDSTAEIK